MDENIARAAGYYVSNWSSEYGRAFLKAEIDDTRFEVVKAGSRLERGGKSVSYTGWVSTSRGEVTRTGGFVAFQLRPGFCEAHLRDNSTCPVCPKE